MDQKSIEYWEARLGDARAEVKKCRAEIRKLNGDGPRKPWKKIRAAGADDLWQCRLCKAEFSSEYDAEVHWNEPCPLRFCQNPECGRFLDDYPFNARYCLNGTCKQQAYRLRKQK